MKEDVFNQYVDRAIQLFGINREEFFSKTKKREIVEARQLVFFLCYRRPIQIIYIQKFMNDNGYSIKHPSIIYGINVMKSKVEEDKDYKTIIQDIERAVHI